LIALVQLYSEYTKGRKHIDNHGATAVTLGYLTTLDNIVNNNKKMFREAIYIIRDNN
jgi:hypothetical protein